MLRSTEFLCACEARKQGFYGEVARGELLDVSVASRDLAL
jgi:hypothetical protein